MDKKAFTLVELLGVITILGLISLLVAPTIINQIRNSKGKIDEVTEKLIYSATDLYLDSKQSEFPKTNGSTYCIELRDLVNDSKLSNPVMDASGNEISLDQIIKVDIVNNNYNYSITNSCQMKIIYTNGIMRSENKCILNNEVCTITSDGIMVTVQVNDGQTENFYVLSDNGQTITLILNRNLGDDVLWYDGAWDNSYGPIAALTALQDRTNAWTNLPKMTINKFEDDAGVEKTLAQSFTMYTRLPKHSEINDIITNNGGTMPTWLYINLKSTGNNNTVGYWTSTADSSDSGNARNVYYDGVLFDDRAIVGFFTGVRPVITLVK